MKTGTLFLEDGTAFSGKLAAGPVKGTGEVVFTTGMAGYYETLTDPSYRGQIVVFTYPLVGNYGVADSSRWESNQVHASGVVVSEACIHWSSADGQLSLADWLEQQGVPLLVGIDTRRLTKLLRESGVKQGVIADTPTPIQHPAHNSVVSDVSTKIVRKHGAGIKRVVMVDCGMKANILRSLLRYPLEVIQVPYDYDYSGEDYDGVFLSNGPGDPQHCEVTIAVLQQALKRGKPIFGICLGAQLMALAAGANTYKLRYGHRGHNQPCQDTRNSRCYITSQNHGYAIDAATLPEDWMVTFRNLNDGTVEGIGHRQHPYQAVQFHPEAAPGPTDTQWFFEHFYASL